MVEAVGNQPFSVKAEIQAVNQDHVNRKKIAEFPSLHSRTWVFIIIVEVLKEPNQKNKMLFFEEVFTRLGFLSDPSFLSLCDLNLLSTCYIIY